MLTFVSSGGWLISVSLDYSIKMGTLLDNLVAIGLPSAILYFFSIIPLRRVYRARAWLETPCVILHSAVEENQTESGVYRILVTYMYEVAGKRYSSSRYDFSTGATSGFRAKKSVVNRSEEHTSEL